MPGTMPFALPDFYLPWPARLNPNIEAIREHSRKWAQEMGMLAAGIWHEAKFDKADYALLSSYCNPDASESVLSLIADWYIWTVFFDDWFLERYKRTADRTGATEYVAQTSQYMPIDVGPGAPEPADPVQRGLAELWARTVPLMSLPWRIRFAGSTLAQMRDALWELDNIIEHKVPSPAEYLEFRRGTGAGGWAADLVELALDAEVPAAVVGTWPLRELRDAGSDAACLRNDIFSYQREIEAEGEVNNYLLVLERLQGLNPQQAAAVVNDVITSRMQQFESVARNELPALFEEYGLDPAERRSVLRYAQGLRDAQAGCHEWYRRTCRYAATAQELDAALHA
jgi:Terpene synthase family, metal binding domain.